MKVQDIKKIACIGTGVIGSSWASYYMYKGYPVILYDIKEELITAAKANVERNLKFFVTKNIITQEQYDEIIKLASYTTSMEEAVKDVQFIQESGPENYEIKQKILANIEEFAADDAIIASSTSGLIVTEIAKYAKHPERVIGAHPYNPPHLIPLVEMTKGEKTSEEILKVAYEFYQLVGKEPVILQKESLGFIANRIQAVLYREVVNLVLNGVCSVEDVDKAVTFGPGIRWGIMGPNMIFNLGSPNGIKEMADKLLSVTLPLWLPDCATWTDMPAGWGDVAQKGIEAAIENRPAELGKTRAEIMDYRDDMLIGLLKLHGKF